ncbi:unnamed protein product [Sphagnum jensenii]|uniref:Protein MIZU-KUSSEI 1 n=1 Tax=Sphagnum jensenii TaxID=128206 RepID=A0ABP0XJI3_9BRYO
MATAMITNFFKKATPADIEEQKKRDAMYWVKRKEEEAEKLARDEERRVPAQKVKRPVRRPKMKHQPDMVLISPVEEVEVEKPVATQPPTTKIRTAATMSKTSNYKVEKERVAESMLGSAVTGTLYGQRKGRVTFCVQEDSRSAPLLLLEFAMPTQSLVREMSTGLLRIALECEKSNKNACKDLKAGGLFAEPVWTMFCNGRKVGFAIKRQLVDADRDVLGVMQSVTMGAGVIPAAVAQEAACKQAAVVKRDSDDDQAIMYMRARYERVAGSPDNLSFHMINPNGSPGQELSIFFIRV